LFGLNLAKSTKDNFFILVEGYMDVISLHQNGITSAIATLGTALTPEQARIIKRLKSEVVIAYDSDEAGQNATRRAIELLSAEDITVRVLTMGDCKDPDEYIKKNGRGAFWELVKNAKLQIEYKISKLQEKYNLEIVEEKVKYINELATEFAKIKSPVEREIYINKISSETGVSASAISKETERICAINERKSKISTFSPSLSVGAIKNLNPKKENILRAERLLLNLMSTDKDIAQMAEKALESSDFEEGMHRDLFELFISIYASGAQPDIRLIASQIKDSALILHDNQYIEDKNLAAKELISLIKAERAKRKLLETVTSENITMQQKLTEMEKCLRRKVGSDEQR
jgi:DNA primase